MNLNLKGKNALVCGSSKGIGKAAAFELAQLGANVTLVARTGEKLAAVKQELPRVAGQNHDFLVADFGNIADLQKKVSGLVALKPIHILVNNTGGPGASPLMDASLDDFKQAFQKHVICNHVLTRLTLKGMKASKYGRIINIISTSVKEPLNGLGVSNTIRNAVANWAKTLSNEIGQTGITVNNVLPGFTQTERLTELIQHNAEASGMSEETIMKAMQAEVPLGRFADPKEIAAAIAFLASPAASYITGTNLVVDGGRTKSL
ncbi:MAG: SDR family oxidoreductase [Saprospiraceae bacterium]|nr:SDR family oxidoreductase [Saprospiraceae bacterium]